MQTIISKTLSEIISEISAGSFPYRDFRERLNDKLNDIDDAGTRYALQSCIEAIVYSMSTNSSDEMVYRLRLVEELINSATGRSDMYAENPYCS